MVSLGVEPRKYWWRNRKGKQAGKGKSWGCVVLRRHGGQTLPAAQRGTGKLASHRPHGAPVSDPHRRRGTWRLHGSSINSWLQAASTSAHSRVQLSASTEHSCQAPLSMEFFRCEASSGLPCPEDPRNRTPVSFISCGGRGLFITEPPGKLWVERSVYFSGTTGHVGAGWAWGAREPEAGASPVVQGLRLCAQNAGRLGLIPGQGARCHS